MDALKGGNIFLIQDGGELVEMREQPYATEDILQELLAKYPNLLAGNQIDAEAPRRWLLVSREVGIPGEEDGADRWSIDNVFLDQDAIPTLVEVKRSSDTRIRREVLGQMLDYAANATVYWSAERLRSRFEEECNKRGTNSENLLYDFLQSVVDTDQFWKNVKSNLQAGKIRMVFVADVIPNELRRVVEFLNGQMDPAEVLAVEVRQFVGPNGMKTLVPRLIGQTAEAELKKGGPRAEKRQWDKVSFLKEIQSRSGEEAYAVALEILSWWERTALSLKFGRGAKLGTVEFQANFGGVDHIPFGIQTDGAFTINFNHMMKTESFASVQKREEMRSRLNAIPGIFIKEKNLNSWTYQSLKVFSDPANLSQLLSVFDWYIGEVKSR